MNTLPYPIVSPQNPILIVYVKGMNLADIVSVGETALYIQRVGDLGEYAKYYPFEERNNQLSFAFDHILFDRQGGRYNGRLVYKGMTVQSLQFISQPDVVSLTGRSDV